MQRLSPCKTAFLYTAQRHAPRGKGKSAHGSWDPPEARYAASSRNRKIMKTKKGVAATQELETMILRFLEEHGLTQEESAVVAFSGGVDSSVLLSALAGLGIYRLTAVHVSHGLRPEAELAAERQLISSACERLGVPLEVISIRRGAIEQYARRHGTGIEDAARYFRYCALDSAARRAGANLVFTAHNQNDRIETLLSRFLNASSLDGFAAIHEVRNLSAGCLVARPMLDIRRDDIEAYAREHEIRFSCDSTNSDTHYYRNRIRATLMPLLDAEFPGWRSGVLGTAERLRQDQVVLAQGLDALLSTFRFDAEGKKVQIPVEEFNRAPLALRARALTVAISKLNALAGKGAVYAEAYAEAHAEVYVGTCAETYVGTRAAADTDKDGTPTKDARLSSRAILDALQAIADRKSHFRILGWEATIADGFVTIAPGLDFIAEDGYFFLLEGETRTVLGPFSLCARWETQEADGAIPVADGAQTVCTDRAMSRGDAETGLSLYGGAFSFPLVVRSKRPGDSIELVHGPTAVDDIVKAWHIEPRDRGTIAVIEDRKGIVAVLPWGSLGQSGVRPRFRSYDGPRQGEVFRIEIVTLTLKGEPTTDVR